MKTPDPGQREGKRYHMGSGFTYQFEDVIVPLVFRYKAFRIAVMIDMDLFKVIIGAGSLGTVAPVNTQWTTS